MKQTTQPKPLLVIALLSCAVMMGTIYTFTQKKALSPEPVTLVPTKQIGSEQSIGGQPEPTTRHESGAEKAPSPSTSHSKPPAPSSAPKQESIKKTIAKEYIYRALGVTPNDPYYTGSWAMQNTNASTAWDVSTGSPVTVAVIDTGFALNHEDLATKWHTNAGELGTTSLGDPCWTGAPADKSANGCDDDTNGYVDDWRGWNFYNMSNNPMAGSTQENGIDAITHGTSVSGLIGAATNNGKGIAAFNWQTNIMPLEALSDNGEGISSDVIAAIYYAVDNGAQIINMSLGGPDKDPALQTAIDYAYAQNVVVIAAAGNCGTTGDAGCGGLPAPTMMYPAVSNHVIAVGATTSNNTRASFSSYGPEVDIVAPGSGSMISPLIDTRTIPFNDTTAYSATLYGTSFASPMVASIASLIKSLRPNTTVDDIVALIDATATKVPAMNGALYTNEYGHGLVNAQTAATIAASLTASGESTPGLLQTGDYRSEHTYSASATMGSGCITSANTYCSVMAVDSLGNIRYLPYSKANASGQAGWQWSGSTLNRYDTWSLKAVQGSLSSSTPYYLFAK